MSPEFTALVIGSTGTPESFAFPEYLFLVPLAWCIYKVVSIISKNPRINKLINRTGLSKLKSNTVQALILISFPLFFYLVCEIEVRFQFHDNSQIIVNYFYGVLFLVAAGRGLK